MSETINVIEITFANNDALWMTGALYQWDTGQALHFNDGFPDGTEVQFGRRNDAQTVNRVIEGGYVQIPNELLQSPDNLIAWVVMVGEDHQTTVKRAQLDVKKRNKPADYVAPADEQTFRSWVQQQVNSAVETTKASEIAAAESAAQAEASAGQAEESANRAEASVAGGQYVGFEMGTDGHLYMTKTPEAGVDFSLVDGHLIMEV